MLKLDRLVIAMATHEGWLTSKEDPKNGGSQSWRHHNPGNLRKSPFSNYIENGFCVFETDMDGWAAFKWDILQKAEGNTVTGLNGNSTIRDLIYKWAPSADGNNPETYLTEVLAMTGFSESMQLKELIQ